MIYDQIGRAYGILTNACVQSSKEAMNLLSMLRLGLDLGLVRSLTPKLIDELFLATQPAHLQKLAQQKLTADQRDVLRASLLRDRLKDIQSPKRLDPGFPPAAGAGDEGKTDIA